MKEENEIPKSSGMAVVYPLGDGVVSLTKPDGWVDGVGVPDLTEKKPILVERYADNGTFSHWALIGKGGELLWSEAPGEEMQNLAERIAELLNRGEK